MAGTRRLRAPIDVDAVVGDRPAYLARVDVHSAAASTALRRLGAESLPTCTGFHPQHPLTADAHHLVRAAARGRLTPEQRARARIAALDAAAAFGIVAVHECAGPDIGGLDDWDETPRPSSTAWRSSATGVRRSTTRRPGARPDRSAPAPTGWPATCSSTARSARAPPGCTEPYTDAPDCCGNAYLDADAITAHLHACTEAGITAGFHVIGDAAVAAVVDAFERVVDRVRRARGRPVRAPPRTPRDGHRRAGARLGAWGVHRQRAAEFRRAVGRRDGHVRPASRAPTEPRSLNPLALLASQGVPLAFGSDSPVTGMNPWATVRAATRHQTPGSAISARAAFAAATRGAWRAAGVRDGVTGHPGSRRAGVVRGLGRRRVRGERARPTRCSAGRPIRGRGCPRCRDSTAPLPRCRQTVHRGVVIHG